jgi:hypothetical protein
MVRFSFSVTSVTIGQSRKATEISHMKAEPADPFRQCCENSINYSSILPGRTSRKMNPGCHIGGDSKKSAEFTTNLKTQGESAEATMSICLCQQSSKDARSFCLNGTVSLGIVFDQFSDFAE